MQQQTLKALIAFLSSLLLCLSLTTTALAYEWTIEDEDLAALGSGKEKVSLTGGAFELKIPALIPVNCSGMTGTGEITEGGKGKHTLKFTGCAASEFESVCSVMSPGSATGTMTLTATTLFFAQEISGSVSFYESFSPVGSLVFEGEECPLTAIDGTLSGTTPAEAPNPSEEPKKRPQKFSEAIAKKAGSSLAFGGSPAYLTGEAVLEFSGEHAGQPPKLTAISISPNSIVFTGTGESNLKLVTVKNIGNTNRVKITDISIDNGPFTLTDFANPTTCKARKLLPGANCSVSVKCNTHPGDGSIVFQVEELAANDTVIVTDGRGRAMTC